MDLLRFILIQVILLIIQAIFSASETAVISLDDTKLRRQAQEGDKTAARLLRMLNDGVVTPDGEKPTKTTVGLSRNDFLLTVRICVTLVSIFCAVFTVDGAAKEISSLLSETPLSVVSSGALELIAKILIIFVLTFLMTVFGRMIPQRMAMKSPEGFSRFACPLLMFFGILLRPMISLVSVTANAFLKPDKAQSEATTALSEDEIRYLLTAGEKKGTIDSDEREMIDNIFEFNDITADQVMTHRTDMVVIWEDDTQDEIMQKIRESGFSRFPVCGESIDEIKGIVRTREYLLNLSSDQPKTLQQLLAKPFFVPETAKADVLFSRMQMQKTHMAVVIDEYGGTAGLLTMEDLLEEIVGNIYDETDVKDEQTITHIAPDTWKIAGTTPIEEVEETLGVDLASEDEDYGTLGGLIYSCLAMIPADGSHPRVKTHGLEISVDEIADHRVEWATVKKLVTDDEGEKEEEKRSSDINVMTGI